MANKSKQAVKEELNKLGIPFSTDNYQELCGLLKESAKKIPEPLIIGKPVGVGTANKPPANLDPTSDDPIIKRALKIGIIPERIALFTSLEELKRQCQLIKPQSTALNALKKIMPKKQIVREGYIVRGDPARITCTVEMTVARSKNVARCTYDEGQLGDFLQHERIDARCVNNLYFDRCCTPKKGVLVTVITIDYMKE